MVPAMYVHFAVCGLLAVSGFLAILFGLTRGGRVRARMPFVLGGLVLVLYAASYGVTYWGSRFGVLAGMAEGSGRGNEQTQMVRKLEALSFPAAALEPIAVLMLALGFGAIARATPTGAAPAGTGTAPSSGADDGPPGEDDYPFDD